MYVEHRRERHVDVVAMQAALLRRQRQAGGDRQRVQHQLAVAEVDTFGQAGGAGGVEGGGARILVEVAEFANRRGLRQQFFVFARETWTARRRRTVVADQHAARERRQFPADLFEHREEIRIHQQYIGLCVVQRVGNLLGRQAHVDGLQHAAEHRHGEKTLEIAMAVPVHDGDGVAGLQAELAQHVAQALDAHVEVGVSMAALIVEAVDNLLGGCGRHGGMQQLLDQQRIAVGLGRAVDDVGAHAVSSCCYGGK